MATEIGIIKAIIGTATATSADGSVRNLQVGDKVYQNDLITTGVAGAVEIEFLDGSTMDMGRSSQAVLDLDMFDPNAPVTETAETLSKLTTITSAETCPELAEEKKAQETHDAFTDQIQTCCVSPAPFLCHCWPFCAITFSLLPHQANRAKDERFR